MADDQMPLQGDRALADVPRYAAYFAPAEDSPWTHFGRLWLSGAWQPPGIDGDTWQALLREPRRYGFHATLKAPFRLAPGASEGDLLQRMSSLAERLRAVPLPAMAAQALEGYVALTPLAPPPALQSLAERCVLDLDDLRAPLSPQEWARRQPHRLDERGRTLLQAHGYPYVLDRFRFHMTLAMASEPAHAAAVLACVRRPLAALQRQTPLALDRLCLFVEPGSGQGFVRRQDFVLQG